MLLSWFVPGGGGCYIFDGGGMSYLVFAGSRYYPYGGAFDLVGPADSLPEAKALTEIELGKGCDHWAHIYCCVDKRVILCNDDDNDGWYDPDT